ncbi:hypothetical protein K505DRAFT_343242 [Melanomma pulvis-pyrius CBS 109.77]|uniref:Uncharacterized protein n=1 Tax=Melanomma pulvis-pyrius CBS 109.77 TaxID=1314802 RepID=A0A6A6WTF4_9PLEO|nr:hypothetical protein K505DRAFT_343242 [Melanomma pulvis-pyrius CBS 109.77]
MHRHARMRHVEEVRGSVAWLFGRDGGWTRETWRPPDTPDVQTCSAGEYVPQGQRRPRSAGRREMLARHHRVHVGDSSSALGSGLWDLGRASVFPRCLPVGVMSPGRWWWWWWCGAGARAAGAPPHVASSGDAAALQCCDGEPPLSTAGQLALPGTQTRQHTKARRRGRPFATRRGHCAAASGCF